MAAYGDVLDKFCREDVLMALNQANLWIQVIDSDANLVFVNEHVSNKTGLSRDQIHRGDAFWENIFSSKSDGMAMKERCHNAISKHDEFSDYVKPVMIKSKKLRFVTWSLKILSDQNNGTSGGLLIGYELPKYEKKFQEDIFKRYYTIFDQAPVGFFISLPEGRFLEVNTTFAKMMGYETPREILSTITSIGDQLYADPAKRAAILEELLKDNEIRSYELEIKKRSGEKLFVRMNIRSRFDDQLNKTVLEGTFEDITISRHEHENLVRTTNHLSSLLKAMDESVLMLDAQARLMDVVSIPANMHPNLPIPEIGKNIAEYFGNGNSGLVREKVSECLEKQETVNLQLAQKSGNTVTWFDANLTPFNNRNVLWVSRNVTDKVYSNQINNVMLNISRSVSISNNIDDLFDIIRTELAKVIDVRNFFIALYNEKTNSLSLPYFRDERDSFTSFPAQKTLSELVLSQKKAVLLRQDEIEMLAASGTIRIVGTPAKVWIGVPLMVEGEVLGILVVQNYESETAFSNLHLNFLETISSQVSLSIKRKQDEQLIVTSEKMLRESNATKDRLFNIIAHDLKNPFNAIMGFTNLLLDDWNDFDETEKVDMVRTIKNSSKGAYDLLINLLEWSRLQVGGITINPGFIEINKLVDLNFSLIRPTAAKKGVSLFLSEQCEKMVWADFNLVNTALRNLLSNAVKFTNINGEILVSCTFDPEMPHMLILKISDNGVGIDPKKIEGLFQVSPSKSTMGTAGEAGSGLGLVICKEFVEKNKGKIWVESEPGKGSTFFIALPKKPM